ncbi:hypothetical protein PV05_01518 [Exophiala xenobiotica]|uniref:Uncharacterized protein n=1 Tax=Exophiala xenobiotica TaxID=348802 RepID=A0A0D2FMR2_9EURO|nr:uncharacterized protein PV05_01518 [Exophiala xenobiotica]KIW61389.1 hypothetical protein PV05_01518 [Exophiala xenobiotica]
MFRPSVISDLVLDLYHGRSTHTEESNELPKFNQRQTALLRRLVNGWTSIYIGPWNLGQDALQASSSLTAATHVYRTSLPDDQWITEVKTWWSIYLAAFQRVSLDWAVGPSEAQYNPYVTRPNTTLLQSFCGKQTSLRPRYFNLNVLGMFFTLFFGIVVIIMRPMLPTILRRFQLRPDRERGRLAARAWETHELLHLHKQRLDATNGHANSSDGTTHEEVPLFPRLKRSMTC